ncbi:hypothetical protein EHS25_010251 [Saitozyma podzolica]|uniref:Atos-like conserved domain-containing protein n=1 Tax=Saitozyma podzolica TaxID=1890683 RepID=A0A427YJ06_9TREE|nr:hypothetical protein EHS25_010251 [Saitozyma podzolica]
MSHAHPPHSLPSTSTSAFTLVLGAVGKGRTCPHDLRCPPHIQIPFSATYYDLEHASARGTSTSSPGRGAVQTPWTATIDLESHYFDAYATSPVMTASASTFQLGGTRTTRRTWAIRHTQSPRPTPPYPGYRVAPVGQLQLLVKSPSSAVKVFLVPYDLRDLPVGGRLLARERTWVETAPAPPTPADASTNAQSTPSALPASTASTSPPLTPCSPPVARRESLRYALQLQFICVESDEPPSSSASPAMPESATTRHRAVSASASLPGISSHPTQSVSDGQTDQSMPTRKAYYVSKSIKVIFASNPQRRTRSPAPNAPTSSSRLRPRLRLHNAHNAPQRWAQVRGDEPPRQGLFTFLGWPRGGVGSPPQEMGGEATGSSYTCVFRRDPNPDFDCEFNTDTDTDFDLEFNRIGRGLEYPIPPVSPVSSPLSAPIPLPLLSPAAKFAQGRALPTIESRDTSRSSSPGPSSNGASAGSNGSNGPNGFPQRTASPQPPSIRIPVAQRYTRTKLRRGSGSIEERELSEKLRAMRMTTAEQDQEQERGIPGAPGTPGAPE